MIVKFFNTTLKLPNDIVKDSAVLTLGTIVAQVISVLSMIALARIYPPATIGALSVLTSIINILVPLSSGCYNLAIPLPRNPKVAISLLHVSSFLSIAISALLSVIAFSVLSELNLLSSTYNEMLVALVVIGVFSSTSFQGLTYLTVRMKDFRLQAYSKVVAISLASILQIMLGALVANNVTNLLLSLIVGWIAASLVVTSNYRKEIRFFRSNTLKLKAYAAANVFRNFPLHIAPGNILDVLSISLAPLLLSLSFKAEELGYYSLAMMIITAPIALFGKALSQVFYQRLSAASKVGHLYDEFNRISKPILFWGCIFSLFLALAAPLITEIIFGEPWIETGYYIRILCPILLLQFQANALSPILLVAGETSKLFKVQLYLAIATISSLCIGPLYMPNAHSTLLLYSLFSSVAYLYYLRSIKTSAAKLQK